MLIPVGAMSMLTVLFLVLWQALDQQTNSINALQQHLSDLEQRLQDTSSSTNSQLMGQQLEQLQRTQRKLEERVGNVEGQQSNLLDLEQHLRYQLQQRDNEDSIQVLPGPLPELFFNLTEP
ncbi:MAG: hypothetical protein ACON4T_10380 [Synechococcus sp.]